MHILSSLWEKETRTVIGLMSGTSADGIDAALTRISGHGKTFDLTEKRQWLHMESII